MEIIFEDNRLIVLSKACGEIVVLGRNSKEKPLTHVLSEKFGRAVYPVHRLDKETSGVCLFAKDPETQRLLSHLFETRKIKKTYLALVEGKIEGEGSIETPLKLFGSGRTGVSKEGKPSVTRYRALCVPCSRSERVPNHLQGRCCDSAKNGERASLLEVSPLTGRRHQIRAHLYSIGHPVLGDNLYGRPSLKATRLMLHALSVSIPGENWPEFRAPIPKDFEDFTRALFD